MKSQKGSSIVSRAKEDELYFSEIFFEVTGFKVEEATLNEDGWLFIPPSVPLHFRNRDEKDAISQFGWKNHLVNGARAGWWVAPWKEE